MKRLLLSVACAASFALPAFACDGLHIEDPYARASTMMSQSGAAFMRLVNHGDADCRLIGAQSDAAQRVELHTHTEDENGVMRMIEVTEGFAIPAKGEHALARGGDHLMFLGLNQPFNQGDEIRVTLSFEVGDDMDIVIPVDLERAPEHQPAHGHSHSHSHSHN
jgi:copper(I)-binding protein